ncbi:MAG: hypothetical protein ACK58N_19320 [Synechocystis sp.]
MYSWNGTNGIRHKNAAVLFPSMVVADFGLLPPGQKKFNGLAIANLKQRRLTQGDRVSIS